MKRADLPAVAGMLRRHPVVALLGARQVGKTTLAGQIARDHKHGGVTWFDLEDPDDLAQLSEPKLALSGLRGLVVLDEIQRRPDLFPLLRVLADRPRTPARFLLLGSASPELLQQSSESLAGRIAFHRLSGFTLPEVDAQTGGKKLERLWFRGGFPRSYLANSDAASEEWRTAFVRTFLERDLLPLGIGLPAAGMERFWGMLAHDHAQIWNGSELGRAFGVSHTTVAKYLDALTGTFVVTRLQPLHEKLGKRLVKAPKVYLTDTGLLHTLLDIRTRAQLWRHPKVGASFEGFVLHALIAHLGIDQRHFFFWATHAGAELDVVVEHDGRRFGFEVKRTSTPAITKSMRIALEDLQLESLTVVHAGARSFALADNVRAVAVNDLWREIKPLRKRPT
jgi:predicted AAA+ superfamily ATPase